MKALIERVCVICVASLPAPRHTLLRPRPSHHLLALGEGGGVDAAVAVEGAAVVAEAVPLLPVHLDGVGAARAAPRVLPARVPPGARPPRRGDRRVVELRGSGESYFQWLLVAKLQKFHSWQETN